MADFKSFLTGNSDALVQLGAGLLSGRTASEQLAGGLTGFAQGRKQQKIENTTLGWLNANNPEIGQLMQSGAISPAEAIKMAYEQKQQSLKSEKPLIMGDRILDPNTYDVIKDFSTPKAQPQDPYEARKAAAAQIGLSPEDPRYQSYVLTGKMPREDAQPLTAGDKNAILSADEAVQTNQSAIDALGQAERINDQANSGYFAGGRAALGNNLPDFLVPDAVSSPESSAATTEYDNLVMGSALTQLKSIFGGNPTEGERAILLDLQASSSKPPEVRKQILARAKDLAQKRLEFNRQRASELRGGTYYQPQGGQGGAPVGKTSNGLTFTVEP
jgi:hypothetical protein